MESSASIFARLQDWLNASDAHDKGVAEGRVFPVGRPVTNIAGRWVVNFSDGWQEVFETEAEALAWVGLRKG